MVFHYISIFCHIYVCFNRINISTLVLFFCHWTFGLFSDLGYYTNKHDNMQGVHVIWRLMFCLMFVLCVHMYKCVLYVLGFLKFLVTVCNFSKSLSPNFQIFLCFFFNYFMTYTLFPQNICLKIGQYSTAFKIFLVVFLIFCYYDSI